MIHKESYKIVIVFQRGDKLYQRMKYEAISSTGVDGIVGKPSRPRLTPPGAWCTVPAGIKKNGGGDGLGR